MGTSTFTRPADRDEQVRKAQEFKARKQLEGKFGGRKAIEKALASGDPVKKEAIQTAQIEAQLKEAAQEDARTGGTRFQELAKTVSTFQTPEMARRTISRFTKDPVSPETVRQLREVGLSELQQRQIVAEQEPTTVSPDVPPDTPEPIVTPVDRPTAPIDTITGSAVKDTTPIDVVQPPTIRALTEEEQKFGILSTPFTLPERTTPEIKERVDTIISQPSDKLEQIISDILKAGVEGTLQFTQSQFNTAKSFLTKERNKARMDELRGKPKTIISEANTAGITLGLLVLTTGEALGKLAVSDPKVQQEIIRKIPPTIREGVDVGDPRKLPASELVGVAAFETLTAFSPTGLKNVVAKETIQFTAGGKPIKVTTVGLEIKNTGRSLPIYTKVEGAEDLGKIKLEDLDKAVKIPATKTGVNALIKRFDLPANEADRLKAVIDTVRLQFREKGLLAKDAVFELGTLKDKTGSGKVIMDFISDNEGVIFGSAVTQKLPDGFKTKIGDIDVVFPTKTEQELFPAIQKLSDDLKARGENVRVSPKNPLIIESPSKEIGKLGDKVFEGKSGVNPSKFSIGDDELAGVGIGGFKFPNLKQGLVDRTVPLGTAKSITVGEQLERKGAAVTFLRPAEFANTPEVFQVAGILPKGRRTKDIPSFIITSKGITAIQKDSANVIKQIKGARADRTLNNYIESFTPEQQSVIQEMINDVQLEGAKSIVIYKPTGTSAPVVSPIPNIVSGTGLQTTPVIATIPETNVPVIFSESPIPITTATGSPAISSGVTSSVVVPPSLSNVAVSPVSNSVISTLGGTPPVVSPPILPLSTITTTTTSPSPPVSVVGAGLISPIQSPQDLPQEPSPSPFIEQSPSPAPTSPSTFVSPTPSPSPLTSISPSPSPTSPFVPISPSPTPSPEPSPIVSPPPSPTPSPVSPISPAPSPAVSPITPSPFTPPPPVIPRKFKESKKFKETPKDKTRLWRLLVKRQRKFRKVGDLDFRGQQVKKGARFVDNTIDATFKVEPTNKFRKGKNIPHQPNPRIFRQYKIVKGKQVSTPNQWIERRRFRLSSPLERRTLKTAPKKPRKSKKRQGTSLGGMNLFK